MKIRTGFVSNSSTTSFTCELCGHSEAGYDSVGIGDFGFFNCERGHTICFDCVPEDSIEFDDENENAGFWEVDGKYCPICQFEIPSNDDMMRYLPGRTGISKDEVFAKIKEINRRRRKLYSHEYVAHVCAATGLDITCLLVELKEKYGTYGKFIASLRS